MVATSTYSVTCHTKHIISKHLIGISYHTVGVSMGGIIVTNAIGRSVLTDTVDGAVSVSGELKYDAHE